MRSSLLQYCKSLVMRFFASVYAGKKNVLNAKELMKDKARHILRHYITRIMQGKFKAQVAASERQACVLYQQYLTAAKDELIQELEPTFRTLT